MLEINKRILELSNEEVDFIAELLSTSTAYELSQQNVETFLKGNDFLDDLLTKFVEA